MVNRYLFYGGRILGTDDDRWGWLSDCTVGEVAEQLATTQRVACSIPERTNSSLTYSLIQNYNFTIF